MQKIIKYIFIFFISIISINLNAIEENSNNKFKYVNTNNKDLSFGDGVDFKILYFFSYGCPYCYDFENYKQWFLKNKSEKIDLLDIPISANPSWINYTKAYFIAESLKIDIRKSIFMNIHIDNKKILTENDLSIFFTKYFNVSQIEFDKRYHSSSIKYKMNKNEKVADFYNVESTPSVVIISKKTGKSILLSPSVSGGIESMMISIIELTK